ncbi:MAG: DNA-binding response regulator [Bacteroidetes bacterium]|jgi:two-component system, LytTR family, response regulator LytT|nr:MAG: DNA-binding response regulator [Bacteroidota bacterium]TAF90363.1 MAG: DNA-binding response regulator [Bacteroidota bacterium]
MINAVIIEDEKYAARFLIDLLEKVAPDLVVLEVLENVQDSMAKLPLLNPDLVFADIQLDDGVSFTIFEKLLWKKQVIFITAYDSYAIQAFKVNGIDYLLKPCDEEELKIAIERFRNNHINQLEKNLQSAVQSLMGYHKPTFKERLAVTIGSRIISIAVQDIAYFFFANRVTYLVTTAGQKYPYVESLDALYHQLNPLYFFRINRNYILHYSAIDKIENHAGRVITVCILPAAAEGAITVSKDKISEFKYWLNK